MNGNGKRIVALCILLIVGGGWAGLASRYTNPTGQAEPPAQTEARPFLSDPNALPSSGAGLGGTGLFLRMMLSVVIVIGLGVAALYLSKNVLPRMTNTAGREIRVVETACLGPCKALHLVEVGSQRLLIGSTNDSITMLTPVGDSWLDVHKEHVDGTVEV